MSKVPREHEFITNGALRSCKWCGLVEPAAPPAPSEQPTEKIGEGWLSARDHIGESAPSEQQKPTCEHCGTPIIDNCLRCGAPQCCPKCCESTTREAKSEPVKKWCPPCVEKSVAPSEQQDRLETIRAWVNRKSAGCDQIKMTFLGVAECDDLKWLLTRLEQSQQQAEVFRKELEENYAADVDVQRRFGEMQTRLEKARALADELEYVEDELKDTKHRIEVPVDYIRAIAKDELLHEVARRLRVVIGDDKP